MTRTQKVFGALAAMGAAAFVLWPRRASATPAPPMPSGSGTITYPSPPDGMPWNRYSVITLNRQREYNTFAAADQFYGFPLLVVDGILGPLTCEALSENIYRIQPAYPGSPPIACGDVAWRTPVVL